MSELGTVLGAGRVMTFAGRAFEVKPLDFNDLVRIEERFGSVESLDFSSVASQLFIVSLILRKSDPSLDEPTVGALLTLDRLPEAARFITEALARSGLVAEADAKNDVAAPDEAVVAGAA